RPRSPPPATPPSPPRSSAAPGSAPPPASGAAPRGTCAPAGSPRCAAPAAAPASPTAPRAPLRPRAPIRPPPRSGTPRAGSAPCTRPPTASPPAWRIAPRPMPGASRPAPAAGSGADPFSDLHHRARARAAVDLEAVHQPLHARQAQPQPPRRRVAILHRLLQVPDPRPVAAGHDPQPAAVVLRDQLQFHLPFARIQDDVARQLRDRGRDQRQIRGLEARQLAQRAPPLPRHQHVPVRADGDVFSVWHGVEAGGLRSRCRNAASCARLAGFAGPGTPIPPPSPARSRPLPATAPAAPW